MFAFLNVMKQQIQPEKRNCKPPSGTGLNLFIGSANAEDIIKKKFGTIYIK